MMAQRERGLIEFVGRGRREAFQGETGVGPRHERRQPSTVSDLVESINTRMFS